MGKKGRKALSKKYESEAITITKNGVEVSQPGLVYIWGQGLVMEPANLYLGKDAKTLKHNETMIKVTRNMANSINEEAEYKVSVFYRTDHQMEQFMLAQKYGNEKKSPEAWRQIYSEMRMAKWRGKTYPPENVTFVDFDKSE